MTKKAKRRAAKRRAIAIAYSLECYKKYMSDKPKLKVTTYVGDGTVEPREYNRM